MTLLCCHFIVSFLCTIFTGSTITICAKSFLDITENKLGMFYSQHKAISIAKLIVKTKMARKMQWCSPLTIKNLFFSANAGHKLYCNFTIEINFYSCVNV